LPPFIPYAAFVTFFPHLVAAPIVRPGNIIPQLTEPEMIRPCSDNLADGTLIFLRGLPRNSCWQICSAVSRISGLVPPPTAPV
jgi:D-alanyl-lipoteichoic acid acyltransferase DltB (MBOAT superfamily)